jgi:hypothetical protein
LGRPQNIPQSVWDSAVTVAATVLRNLPDDYGDTSYEITEIARAILAERNRCERVCRGMGYKYAQKVCSPGDYIPRLPEIVAAGECADAIRDGE